MKYFPFRVSIYILEKEMTTHSRILAWEIPWTEEPGRLQSMGSQRVRSDWGTKCTQTCYNLDNLVLSQAITKLVWSRRKSQLRE
jgi:hypothetical protein